MNKMNKDKLIECSQDGKSVWFSGTQIARLEQQEGMDNGVLLTANVGSKMDVPNFPFPLVLDMAGVEFNKAVTPVIYQHDCNTSLGRTEFQIVLQAGQTGMVGEKSVIGPGIFCRASLNCDNDKAREVRGNIYSDTFPYEVSVGAEIGDFEECEKGKKIHCNGQDYSYPVIIAHRSNVRELSVCVSGADSKTSAVKATAIKEGKSNMDKELKAWIEAKGFNTADLTEQQVDNYRQLKDIECAATAAINAPAAPAVDPFNEAEFKAKMELRRKEVDRQDKIMAMASCNSAVTDLTFGANRFQTVVQARDYAIENGLTSDEFELSILKASTAKNNGCGNISKTHERLYDNSIVACAVLRERGIPDDKLKQWYPDTVLEASHNRQLRNIGFHGLMDLQLQAMHQAGIACSGYRIGGYDREVINDIGYALKANRDYRRSHSWVQAAGSGATTFDISELWEDVSNKVLVSSFERAPGTWEQWCKVVTTKDFKPQKFYTFDTIGQLEPIGNAGQFRHGAMEEGKFQIQTETYGKITGFTRQALINDDMGVLLDSISAMGGLTASTINEVVYVTHLENLATSFTAARGNYVTGADTVLSIKGLDKAWGAFESRVDSTGRPLNITPDRILVGQNQRVTATQIYNETLWVEGLGSTAKANTMTTNKNIYQGMLKPIYDQYINNTLCKQGVYANGAAIPNQTQTGYWLMCSPDAPQGAYMYVSFLNGNRTPYIERCEDDFETLGMKARIYTDFGVSIGRPEMCVYCKGAA